MAELLRGTEVQLVKETENKLDTNAGLHLRLLLKDKSYLDPQKKLEEDIDLSLGNDHREINKASNWERGQVEYTYDEWKRDSIAKITSDKFQQSCISSLEKLGKLLNIDFKRLKDQDIDSLYERYCKGGSKIDKFADDILGLYSKENNTLDLESLNKDLPHLSRIAGIFGKTSEEVAEELTKAKSRYKSNPDSFMLNKEKAQPHNLNEDEKRLLNFIWEHGRDDASSDRKDTNQNPNQDEIKNKWEKFTEIRERVQASRPYKDNLPVYYPGSGTDIIYPLALTNGSELVFVDFVYINDKSELKTSYLPEKEIEKVGGVIKSIRTEGELGKGGKRIVTFDWRGKERHLYCYAEDTTKFKPQELDKGTLFTLIKAPTPFGRTEEANSAPGYLLNNPDALSEMCNATAVGGYIHWKPTNYFDESLIGFKEIVNSYEGDYRFGLGLYVKVKEEAETNKIVQLDDLLKYSIDLRNGRYFRIDEASIGSYQQSLEELRKSFDSLSDEKKIAVKRTLSKILLPNNLSDEDRSDLEQYGNRYLKTEEEIKNYFDQSKKVVLDIFPELNESKEAKIKTLSEKKAKEAVLKITPKDIGGVSAVEVSYDANKILIRKYLDSFQVRREKALQKDNSNNQIVEDEWGVKFDRNNNYYDSLTVLDTFMKRYRLPMLMYNAGAHANLVLSIKKTPDNKWRVVTYDPKLTGEGERKMEEAQPATIKVLEIDDDEITQKISLGNRENDEDRGEITTFLSHIFDSQKGMYLTSDDKFRDYLDSGEYNLSLAGDELLTDKVSAAKMGKFQESGFECVLISAFAGALRTAAKYSPDNCPDIYKNFFDEGLRQWEEDFGFKLATKDQLSKKIAA